MKIGKPIPHKNFRVYAPQKTQTALMNAQATIKISHCLQINSIRYIFSSFQELQHKIAVKFDKNRPQLKD
ncbi:hypothetical protein HMPREF9996_00562 [Aggregatibacter actinomycetemcomitans Y4]|uniref:Uncharacterized protein n=1 Tax=Aggregatibacter actinomycetemcomitans TaxID=714 RepID=A0AB74N6K7_AGGAC|nr:hypothetical protein HMPREF9996_00562 [Aggregatibacter actinomycetemcomitans Y4]OZV18271.1 hypothetical protein RO04_00085 [Aggregatibacter actinomycetemcomitans]PHO20293.1 hypothetical protein CQR80_07450 [Aggregatibacter actinomycetemcomitans]PHO22558.1 hypothetical protein CQR79_07335 [Aggregatibacter actinomycetemcomitans]TYA16861.1 hypothetical protein FXE10_02755 [Aggregatibacter actinomycetemcomitans]